MIYGISVSKIEHDDVFCDLAAKAGCPYQNGKILNAWINLKRTEYLVDEGQPIPRRSISTICICKYAPEDEGCEYARMLERFHATNSQLQFAKEKLNRITQSLEMGKYL